MANGDSIFISIIDKVLPWVVMAIIAGMANLYLDVATLKATRGQLVDDVKQIKVDVKAFREEFTKFLIEEARSHP